MCRIFSKPAVCVDRHHYLECGHVDYFRIENKDLVNRSVRWFGQMFFFLDIRQEPLVYTGLHQHTGRDYVEHTDYRL